MVVLMLLSAWHIKTLYRVLSGLQLSCCISHHRLLQVEVTVNLLLPCGASGQRSMELEPHGQDESGYEDREVNWGLRNKVVCDSGCQLVLINNKFKLGLFQKMCHSG